MQKEVRTMKALIAYSGLQRNNFYLTEDAIRKMYDDNNVGKPLLNKIDFEGERICGYLNKTELIQNKEQDRLELWGYYTYTFEGTDFSKQGECAYQIAYNNEDFDNHCVLRKATLMGCTMMKSLD